MATNRHILTGAWTGPGPASFLCLLIVFARTANAAFSRPAYWKLDTIEQTHAGAWCFHPATGAASARTCGNPTLSALLDAHIKNDYGPGLSIAYYDLADLSVLGGVGWTGWDIVVLPVGVCMSGLVDGLANVYSTTCRFTVADNDHDTPSAHLTECTIGRPQLRVTDGCYSPPALHTGFHLSDSASGILTIIGLLIALPSVIFGGHRLYYKLRGQQKVRLEDEQMVPLVHVDGDGGAVGQERGRSQE